MKVDDLLKIDKKESNRVKALFIRAQVKKKSQDSNPKPNDPSMSNYVGSVPHGE